MVTPFFLAVLACSGVGEPDRCTDVFYADADGDAYGDPLTVVDKVCAAPSAYVAVAGDCDDANADVHPDAVEVCNGADDDCDGAVDDDPDRPSWFTDADGDGHGAPGTAVVACEAPHDSSAFDDDCDDTNAAIYGGAEEVCDTLDNDCDIDVDEGLPIGTWYRDADGDGHGDPNASLTEGCAAPDGYVASTDDCDDVHVHAYDGAPQALTDGVDDNCDGVFSVTSVADLPLWSARGGERTGSSG